MNKFLIIDDEESFLELLVEAVEDEFECEISKTTSPVEGLEIAQDQKYDIILVDFVMPAMSGKSFVKSLRGKTGPNQTTPIIILSAYLENVQEEVKNIKNVSFFDKMYYLTNLTPYIKMILTEDT